MQSLDDENQIEKGLQASVFVHQKLGEVVNAHEGKEYVTMSRKDVIKMRKLVARCNHVLSSSTRMAHAREDRLKLEIAILKASTEQEHVLREANRARNYERLRESFSRITEHTVSSTAPGTKEQVSEVDRVLNSSTRIETALATLAPVPALDTHGAGLVTAMDEGKLDSVLNSEDKIPKST